MNALERQWMSELQSEGAFAPLARMHPRVAQHWEQGDPNQPEDVDPIKEHDVLARDNAHPLDPGIVFREHDHYYAISHKRRWVTSHLTSATSVIAPFGDPFPGDTIAENTAHSQRKLRDEFYFALSVPYPTLDGFNFVYTDAEHALAQSAKSVPDAYYKLAKHRIAAMEKDDRLVKMHAFFGKYMGCNTAAAVKKKWRRAAQFGTEFHLAIEMHLNGHEPVIPCEITWAQYQAFLKECPFEIYRTEWRIYDVRRLITGTIDGCAVAERDKDGKVIAVDLLDWKTNEDIFKTYRPKTLYPPLAHIEDTKVSRYNIQLNVYCRIIEEYYGLRVRNMDILVFNKSYDGFQKIKVERMDIDMDILFDAHERRLVQLLNGEKPPSAKPPSKRQKKA